MDLIPIKGKVIGDSLKGKTSRRSAVFPFLNSESLSNDFVWWPQYREPAVELMG